MNLKTTSINNIEWLEVEAEDDIIWLKTCHISSVQHNSLKKLFRFLSHKLTVSKFGDEIGFWHNNTFSVTIEYRLKHIMDDNLISLTKFIESPELFFDFNKKIEIGFLKQPL